MRFSFLFYEPITTLAELDRRLEIVASLGFQGVELTAFSSMTYPVDEIARLARKHRLPVVSMLSGWSYGNEGLCLSSPDPLVRSVRWAGWVITSTRPPGWVLCSSSG